MTISCIMSEEMRVKMLAVNGRYSKKMFDLFFDKMYNEYVEKMRAQRLTPVSLAFIGDAVHTLYVRECIAEQSDGVVGTLHAAASRLVNAKCQAAVLDELIASGALTAEEADVARRAKNAHLHSRAKAASPDDYHKATALEAVIGYLHVSGEAERERELMKRCVETGLRLAAKQDKN